MQNHWQAKGGIGRVGAGTSAGAAAAAAGAARVAARQPLRQERLRAAGRPSTAAAASRFVFSLLQDLYKIT